MEVVQQVAHVVAPVQDVDTRVAEVSEHEPLAPCLAGDLLGGGRQHLHEAHSTAVRDGVRAEAALFVDDRRHESRVEPVLDGSGANVAGAGQRVHAACVPTGDPFGVPARHDTVQHQEAARYDGRQGEADERQSLHGSRSASAGASAVTT